MRAADWYRTGPAAANGLDRLAAALSVTKRAATDGRRVLGRLGRSVLRLDLDDRSAVVAADPERDRAGGVVHEHVPHVGVPGERIFDSLAGLGIEPHHPIGGHAAGPQFP